MKSSAEKTIVACDSLGEALIEIRKRLSEIDAQRLQSEKLSRAEAEKISHAAEGLFDLLSAVSVSPEPRAEDHGIPATRAAPSGASVLLVEDNTVNRMVAEGMLRQFHCLIDIAENGAEAVKRFSESEYDLIFMDCQMPVMDGFEAVTKIRAIENSSSSRATNRTPIVALTANALKGDRDNCIAAGMDDYVSKPFSVSDIEQVLGRQLGVEKTKELRILSKPVSIADTALIDASSETTINSFCPIVDVKTLGTIRSLTKTDGQQLLNRVIDVFLSTSPKLVDDVCGALASANKRAIVTTAHALRSSCGSVGAARLAQLCQSLEKCGDGRCDEATDEFARQLRVRHKEVSDELGQIVSGEQA